MAADMSLAERPDNPSNQTNMPRFSSSSSPVVGIILLAFTIFLIDAFTPLDIAIAVLYVVVVLCASRVASRRGVLAAGLVCLALTVAAYAINHDFAFLAALARCVVSMAAIGITTMLALSGQAATDELRRRSESLRLSEAFLASTQRISRTSSFRFCTGSSVLTWSDEAARIYGVSEGTVPTVKLLIDTTHPDDRYLVQAAIDQAHRGDPTFELRHRLLMADGAVKHVHVIACLSAARAGDFEYLGALMDVTAAQEAAEALHRTQAQLAHATRITTLGELAASIAHEVNQPLAAVATNGNACLRWLNRPEPDLAEARMALERILADTRRASEVIQRIRTLARRGDAQRKVLDMNRLVLDSMALVQHELKAHAIALGLKPALDLPPVEGDPVQIQQVLINLVMNAMQSIASQPRTEGGPDSTGRRIDIRIRETDGDTVLVTVSDTGSGLSEAHASRLFEAFYTTKDDGMGMGLAICRSIVEAHGGRISVAPHEGKGATLAFTLPTVPERRALALAADEAGR